MTSKSATDERANFADRLRTALVAANQPVGASALCRAYNLRADGAAVTAHGVRKWLKGEAIPTHEKILIIARWLNVHSSWLRFGDAENGQYDVLPSTKEQLSNEYLVLIRDVAALPASAQTIIRDIVDAFLRAGAGDQRLREVGGRDRRPLAR